MKRAFLTAITLLCACLAASAPAQVKLPDMGASTGRIMSPREADKLGRQVYNQIRAAGVVPEDPLLNEYLESVGLRLAAHDAESGLHFTFFVLAEDSVNAFALPGGYIGVHSGLITTAQSESEMAAVLAHEIAHVTQQHLLRRIEDIQQMSLPILLAMLGVILASGGGEATQAAIIGGQAAMIQRQINFTRAHEAEADRVGIRTLSAAGYDPSSMAVFFARMEQSNLAYGDGPSEFLRTHPVTSSRIAEAKGYAADLPKPRSTDSDPYFLLMRARARVLGTERPDQAMAYFQATLPNVEQPMVRYAMRYGQALALIEQRRADQAIKILHELMQEDAARLPYEMALADAWMRTGNTERALERYRGLYQLHGGRYAVAAAYAQALLRAGQPQQAESLLREEVIRRPQDAWLHYLYADAADAAGKPVDARIAIAEAYFLEGRIADAFQQLEQGQKNLGLSEIQRARLAARLEEMKGTFTKEELEDIEDRRRY